MKLIVLVFPSLTKFSDIVMAAGFFIFPKSPTSIVQYCTIVIGGHAISHSILTFLSLIGYQFKISISPLTNGISFENIIQSSNSLIDSALQFHVLVPTYDHTILYQNSHTNCTSCTANALLDHDESWIPQSTF